MYRVATFLINLDRSPERLAAMAGQLEALNMPFTRIAAVEGRQVGATDPRVDAQRYRLRHGREVRPGEIGCYLSHLAVMQAFLATDASHALILEDDATLLPALPDVLARATSREAVGTWDVLKLESRRTGFKLALQQLTPTHALCVNLFRSTGSAGYVLSRHAARVYLDKLLPIAQPFDHAFDRGWFLGLRMREVAPLVVSGQMSEAAVQSTITSTPVVKLTGLAKLPCLAYRTMTETMRVVSGLGTWTAWRVLSAPRPAA
jgi:glycosyl transferase, family 25